MTDANRICTQGTALASMLALGIAGCGGGGGGPGSLSSDEEWQIDVSGARSFSAAGRGGNFESEVTPQGMTLKEGTVDDDTPEGNEQAEVSIDFGTEVDSSSVPTDLMASGSVERYDITFENGFREMDTLATYTVDDEDPETYLNVTIESFSYEQMLGTHSGSAKGTFEGKLVDTEQPGEYVQVNGAFAFGSTVSN